MNRRTWESSSIFRFEPWEDERRKKSIWRRALDRLRGVERREEARVNSRKLNDIADALVRFEAGDIYLETLYFAVRHAVWPTSDSPLSALANTDAGKEKKIKKLEKTVARLRRRCEELLHPQLDVCELNISGVDREKREITLAPTDAVQFVVVPDPVKERVGAKIEALKKTIGELREEIGFMQQNEMALGNLLRRWHTAKLSKREGLTLLELEQIISLRKEPPKERP